MMQVLMSSLVIFLLFITKVSCQLQWLKLTANVNSSIPPGRANHAMVYDRSQNRMLIFGGKGANGLLDDTWQYNLTSNTWSDLTSTVRPAKRFSFVYGITKGFFYISTGEGADGSKRLFFNDIWKFNLITNTWQVIAAKGKGPEPIYGASGGIYTDTSNLFFVTHGFSTQRYASAFTFNVDTETWSQVYDDKSTYIFGHPSRRCLQGGAMTAESSHVFYGGCASGGGEGGACPSIDSWIFNGKKQSWSQLNYCASPRNFASLGLLPEVGGRKRVVMYGGGERNAKRDEVLKVDIAMPDQVAVLDVHEEKWSLKRVGGVSPPKPVGAAMDRHPNGLLVVGGNGANMDVWLLRGNSDDADRSPVHSQPCNSPFAGTVNLIMLHGVFMVIGWGILLQLGAFIARYFRNQDPMWFHLHRIFQILGLLFAIGGLVCAIESVRFDHFKFGHGGLGLFIMIIGLLQPFNAIIRPHKEKGEEASFKRKIWEAIHLNSGRVALILAVIEIPLGLLHAQAYISHHIAWYVYVGVFVMAYVVMEINLRMKGGKTSNSMEMHRR